MRCSGRSSRTASTRASRTRARRRCTSSPRSTTFRRCAPILALFEGVATGAADGYGRMAGTPAATLLHLGPGLGNGLANLHNARRARTPIVNIVGDHATYHQALDAPLASDIVERRATTCRGWVRESKGPETVGADVDRGDQRGAARRRRDADPARRRVVVGRRRARTRGRRARRVAATCRATRSSSSVKALRSGEPAALLLGGSALRERGLARRGADRGGDRRQAAVRDVPGPARARRGAARRRTARLPRRVRGRAAAGPAPPRARRRQGAGVVLRVPEHAERARAGRLRDPRRSSPTASLAEAALEALADAVGAPADGAPLRAARRGPSGRPARSTAQSIAQAVGALLPEGAIVSDEAQTGGLFVSGATAGAPRHDWLTLTGGAIGQGMPVATGAAVACPDRKVAEPRGRRQRDVHAAVAVDAGARGPRRHHDHLRQPLVRDPQPRAVAGRRAHRRQRGRLSSTSRARRSTSSSLARGMGVDATRRRDRRRARRPRSSARSPSPART